MKLTKLWLVGLAIWLGGFGACPSSQAVSHSATVSWKAGVQNYPNAYQYRVYRSDDGGIAFGPPRSVNQNQLSFADTSVTAGKQYWYRVTMYDMVEKKESVPSQTVTTTIPTP